MKIIIKDNERAFLFKNGIFKKMLQPGKNKLSTFFDETVVKVIAEGKVDFPDVNLTTLRKDPEVAKNIAVIDVPDEKLAVHFIDGRIAGVLKPGIYAFWDIFNKNTFEMIDISVPESANDLPVLYMNHLPVSHLLKINVNDGEAGLLFYNGVFQRVLASGQHYFWQHNTKIYAQIVDIRIQQLDVTGQEILTADKVSIRINFVCSFQILDPISVATKLSNYREQLHVMVQLALREFVGKYRFDDLLRQKDSIGGFVLEKLKERESDFYITFSDAGIKDIVLPGEIRDIMNKVLIAEKSAQANVITRREETAATKSLLDTAKMMDENTTLFKLKELEYLERICETIGNISVDGGGGILTALRELVSGKR